MLQRDQQVQDLLNGITDPLAHQHLLDILAGESFQGLLLSHKESLSSKKDTNILKGLRFAMYPSVNCVDVQMTGEGGKALVFQSLQGEQLTLHFRTQDLKYLFEGLEGADTFETYETLYKRVVEKNKKEILFEEPQRLQDAFFEFLGLLFLAGYVAILPADMEPFFKRVAVSDGASGDWVEKFTEYPKTSAFVRFQAEVVPWKEIILPTGHPYLEETPLERVVLAMATGEETPEAIQKAMENFITQTLKQSIDEEGLGGLYQYLCLRLGTNAAFL